MLLVVDVHLIDDDVRARFETGFQDVLLLLVIVAAAAGDEQDFERLRRIGSAGGG